MKWLNSVQQILQTLKISQFYYYADFTFGYVSKNVASLALNIGLPMLPVVPLGFLPSILRILEAYGSNSVEPPEHVEQENTAN